MRTYLVGAILTCLVALAPAKQVHAQAFGIELHNTLMPASGAMGGASIAKPQDVQSALAGNPASMANFYGTQFSFNGAWLEPTFNMSHTGTNVLPGLSPFSGKSEAEGSLLGGFAVSQDLRALGKPMTVGIGMYGAAGAGVSFRDVPASNGTSDLLSVLTTAVSAGVSLTDQLSAGASIGIGAATMHGPFIGVSAAAFDYALRGSIGMNYQVADATTLGLYYQTKQSFNFDDIVRLQLGGGGFTVFQDLDLDLPRNVGIGFADESLCCGRLLVALDVLYKNWDDTALFGAVYEDQWVFQLGTQYKLNKRLRLRAGYVFAENITEPNPGPSAGGIAPPGLQNAIQYVQGQFPAINQHRISAGVGIRDILPGLDMNFFAGGMFGSSERFGAFTSSDLESYWIGSGITWRFGRGHCCDLGIPDDWCLQ